MKNYLEYLNESPTVFFLCTSEKGWPVEFVTKNVKDLFGYSTQDFLSKKISFYDCIYEEDKQKVFETLTSISNTNQEKYEFEPYRIRTKENKILWVQDITKIIRDENSTITHYHCFLTDISKQKEINTKLNISENIISTMYDNSFQFIGLMEPDGTLIKANKTSLEFVHVTEEDVLGKKFWDCPWWKHSIEEQQLLQKEIKEASLGKFIHTQKTHYDDFGNKIYVDFSIKPVFNDEKKVVYLIPEGRNITDSVLIQKQISRHLKIINENVLISTTDLEGKIIKYSDKFKSLCGFSQEELIGNRHTIMKHEDNDDSVYKNLWETITQGNVWSGEHKNVTKDGKIFWVENVITPNFDDEGIIETYTSIYTDITSRKEISELLISDPLTSLYNRRHFNHVFRTELKRSRRHGHNFVLMMIDIDYFKQFNDTYGHHEGDLALVSVAHNLQNSLNRPEDSVFRLGGEEFCVITSDISAEGIIQFANKIRANVENLHIVHNENRSSEYLTISIGVKNVDNDIILDYDDIYKLADDALYKAKKEGRNKIIVN